MKKAPDTVRQHGVLYNSIDNPEIAKCEDRKKLFAAIVTGIAGTVVSVIPKDVQAKKIPVATFGPEINEMMVKECKFSPPPGTVTGALMQGAKPERFKMLFSGIDSECVGAVAVEEFKVPDGPSNEIIIQSLGKPIATSEKQCIFIEVDRGDGKTAKIKTCDDKIYKDDELKWDFKTLIDFGEWGTGWTSSTDSIHSIQKPNHIKIVKGGPFYVKAWENNPQDFADGLPFTDATTYVDINVPNYYTAIQQAINDAWEKEGKDPYEAGLLKHVEDGKGVAPETDRLLLAGWSHFLRFDPQTNEYFYLQRNPDGTYTLENPQIGNSIPDWEYITGEYASTEEWFGPHHMVAVKTSNNRKIHFVGGGGLKKDWLGAHSVAKVVALEELTDEQGETYFKEVPITFEFTDQYPDDDGDGKVNHEDNCRWRANPDQINTTANQYGDSCKADCEQGGWPGVDAVPFQTNSSGLRICKSELGYDFAFSFEDGSTIHSNMDVEVSGGKIILKPGQTVRYIHSLDPRTETLSASNIVLPAGNSVKIKVLSAKNLDGTDGQTIFTRDGVIEYFNNASDWKDFGIIPDGEIENASDIEIEIDNENPLPVVEQEAEAANEAGAEVAIVVEQPAAAEESTQAELVVEKAAEPAGAEFVAEPAQAEPDQAVAEEGIAVAEIPPIVAEKLNAAEEVNIAEQPVSVEPMPDIFVGQPDADTLAEIQQSDTAEQGIDTNANNGSDELQKPDTLSPDTESDIDVLIGPDTDILQNPDIAPNPDTSPQPDEQQKFDIVQPQKDTVQNTDSVLVQPEENKSENGASGGCSCSISVDSKTNSMPHQPTNIDGLSVTVGAIALIRAVRWALKRSIVNY